MSTGKVNLPFIIKNAWLSGLSREDAATIVIKERVRTHGFCNENAIYAAIDATYDTLTMIFCKKDIDTYGKDDFFFVCELLDRR